MEVTGIGYKDTDWVQLAHDRVQWYTFINTVMELHDLENQGIS
jgi:hypothetical protein